MTDRIDTDRVAAEFDACADDYEGALNRGLAVSGESKEYFAEARIAWTAAQLAHMNMTVHNVMDYGCGVGTATPFLGAAFEPTRIVGIDTSTLSIEQAMQTHKDERATFLTPGDFSEENGVDLVYSNGTFHHIPLASRPEALAFVRRALKPGGLFALWENNPWNPGTRYIMSRISFDRDAITLPPPYARELLTQHGFTVLRYDFLFLFPRFMRFLRPLEKRLCRLPFGAQYMILARKPMVSDA